MRNNYPVLSNGADMRAILAWLNRIIEMRRVEDLPDYNNQKSIYISGRTTTRIPSGATDVVAGDRLGDVVYATDASYSYYLVDKSGTLVWARIALATTW